MHTGRHYSLREVATWTRRETALFVVLAAIPTALHVLAGWTHFTLSWPPVAIIGTAVAFITGFKNNAAYGRLWEARQIWGSIVNTSRTFALLALDAFSDSATRRRLIDRHTAWMTALRYQLREPRGWESMRRVHNTEYQRKYRIPEWETPVAEAIAPYLSETERVEVLAAKNPAAQILRLQLADLRRSAPAGLEAELRHLELARQIAALVDAQGRCERIKNFPYPRQFATLNLFFVWLFILLLPLALLTEFQKLGMGLIWLTVPVSTMIAWVFHTMDKIGESSENPFEGGPNDIPMAAMSRTIEIDLREMLGDKEVPSPIAPVNQILM